MDTAKRVATVELKTGAKPEFAVVETDRNPLYISLSQAAKTWHMYKGTISRHVKEGKLQWHNQPDGSRKLFAPEVANLYGAPPSDTVSQPLPSNPIKPADRIQETTGLQAMLDAKDEVIRLLQSQIADQRAQIDRERQIAEQWRVEFSSMKDQVLALPARKAAERKGFWPFRRS